MPEKIRRFPKLSTLSVAIIEYWVEKVIGSAGVDALREPYDQKELENALGNALRRTEERFLLEEKSGSRELYDIFLSLPINELPSFREAMWEYVHRPTNVKLPNLLLEELTRNNLPEKHVEDAIDTFINILQEELIIALPKAGKAISAIATVRANKNIESILNILENTKQPSNIAVSKRIISFDTLIDSSTSNFVGREFVTEAIEAFVAENKSGYFVIEGEPGIGKTAVLSNLVKERNHIHHFNIARQNIRTPKQFLINVSAQLILRYGLSQLEFPDYEDAHDDSVFLLKCLESAVRETNNEPVIVLLDALDEADLRGIPPRVNIHFLPSDLPNGVYIVASVRAEVRVPLQVTNKHVFSLKQGNRLNELDILRYLSRHAQSDHMKSMFSRSEVTEEFFIATLAEKSQGNFMYLRHVLPEIDEHTLMNGLEQLPRGLEDYYNTHWNEMRMATGGTFQESHEKVICVLAVSTVPLPLGAIAEWTGLTPREVNHICKAWKAFLLPQVIDGEERYRIYHNSFAEFLGREVNLDLYKESVIKAISKKVKRRTK